MDDIVRPRPHREPPPLAAVPASWRTILSRLSLGVALMLTSACGDSDSAANPDIDETTPLVTQYFAVFNDGTTDNFHAALDRNPPFDLWHITFIAFLHTYERDGLYVADYENARGHDGDDQPIPPAPGDTDADRIQQLVRAARATNPKMKFIISLGWGRDDFKNGATNPIAFASSVGDIVEANDLDGFDVDYERVDMEEATFRTISQALRAELDARERAMGKRLYLTITPAQLKGMDLAAVNEHYDYVQMQTYDNGDDLFFSPSNLVGSAIPNNKLLFGRDIEGGDTLTSGRYDIPDISAYVRNNRLAGLMGWRVNGGNQLAGPPYFSGVHLLGEAFAND
jgi:GH18 family chitinase